MWDSFNNVFYDIARTNNAIEGWHNVFRSSFEPLNKVARTFVKKLRNEEESIQQKFLGLRSGEELSRKKKYLQLNTKIYEYLKDNREWQDPYVVYF